MIGAGWIGLEVASAARQAGGEVTVVETAPLPLARVLGPEIATVFAGLHREHGVDLRLDTGLDSIARDGERVTVRLSDGHEVSPDLVVVGIGAGPDDRLAAAAGLATDNGVLVDARAAHQRPRTSARPATSPTTTTRRSAGSGWSTGTTPSSRASTPPARCWATTRRTTGSPTSSPTSTTSGMEYVGHVGPDGYDEVVVRGDLEGRVFSALWLAGGRVVAGMHANDWDATDALRAVVGTPGHDRGPRPVGAAGGPGRLSWRAVAELHRVCHA